MNRSLNFLFCFAVFLILCTGEKVETEGETQQSSKDELSKEEIYNINTDMFCQTQLVISEKLLEIENPVNLYESIIGDDIKDIDCEAILSEYVLRVHKRLRKDFKKKGATFKTLNCFMDRVVSLGYDKMRFKFNALYGIEMDKDLKARLRNEIDKEIGDTVELAVDECWPYESSKVNATESAVNTNNL